MSVGKYLCRSLLVVGLLLSPAALMADDLDGDAALRATIDSAERSAKHKARDGFRHPYETLRFFELAPDMSVAEIWPGGGWYAEILAPYLKEKGAYTAVLYDPDSPSKRAIRYNAGGKAAFAERADYFGDVAVTGLDNKGGDIGPAGSFDRVLTFRSLHNWMGGYPYDGDPFAGKAMGQFFRALKPGGMLGVVDHRQPGDKQIDPIADSGYVSQAHVIRLAEAAGFVLAGSSEINANAKDSADHPSGVWTLLPTLTLKGDIPEEELQAYRDIGESDRMTLLFRKPE